MEQKGDFLRWCAGLIQKKIASVQGTDIILDELAGRRFALGIHEDNPLVCWQESDHPYISSINWTSAALGFNLKGGDWIALSANDVRIENSAAMEPVKLRLFIPVTVGRMTPWKKDKPEFLFADKMEMEKGVPEYSGTPSIKLPVTVLSH